MAARAGAVLRAWKIFCYSLGALVARRARGAVLVLRARPLVAQRTSPPARAFMEARVERLREKDPKAKLAHQWVPYERISTQLKRAVVAAEDAKFVDHEGFDWEAISKAIEKNEKKGKVVVRGLDHQPAAGEEPVPLGRALLAAQGRRRR